MTDRLTVDEFFSVLLSQDRQPRIDTPESREKVLEHVRSLGRHYAVQDRWPILDLESAYERYLNNRSDLAVLVRKYGYRGVINLRGFDETYSMDEWFVDFTAQYRLNDSIDVREKMYRLLPPGGKWPAARLNQAYESATKVTIASFFKALFR